MKTFHCRGDGRAWLPRGGSSECRCGSGTTQRPSHLRIAQLFRFHAAALVVKSLDFEAREVWILS
jgi:hypothetical protein